MADDPERNKWGHIFPEDERCIIYIEEDDDDGEGDEIDREEHAMFGPWDNFDEFADDALYFVQRWWGEVMDMDPVLASRPRIWGRH
jgi:hypothetical protein